MNNWVHASKIKGRDLSKLGLKDKDKLHEESRYLLITERTLLDLILGMKDIFKEAVEAILYHAFKRAAERKIESLINDFKDFKRRTLRLTDYSPTIDDYSSIISEVDELFRAEGYYKESTHRFLHPEKKVILVFKEPISCRLYEVTNKLTECEVTAIIRGLVAGVATKLIGAEVEAKRATLDMSRREVRVFLEEEVYDKLVKMGFK